MPEVPEQAGPGRGEGRGPAAQAWARFLANRLAVGGAWMLGLLMAVVLLGPALTGADPNALGTRPFAAPGPGHWLGTDASGRDVLARVCVGTRVSLFVGIAGAVVSLVIGVGWGAVAGYVGGRVDGILMRIVDILYSLPSIIFVIVLTSALRDPVRDRFVRWWGADTGQHAAGLFFLVVGLGAVSWLTMARIVRAQVMALRSRPFIDAARVLGAGPVRILFRHVLPNTAGVVVVYLTLTIPAVVLGESFLSFLGLGIQPPSASLGSLLSEGAGQINPIDTPLWMLLGPGGMLVGMLLALGFVGDGVRDALDPRSGPR